MSWLLSRALCDVLTSLPGQEEDFLQAISLDGEPCVLWNGIPTQLPSWCSDKTMACCQLLRSGMTFKPSQEPYLILSEGLMLWQEAFHVPTFLAREKEQESKGSRVVCGATWQELLVKFDRDTSSWKTAHCLWVEDLPESSVTLPKWGMMRDGELWERITLPDALTSGIASGLSVSTPTAGDSRSSGSRNTKESKAHPGVSLTDYVKEDGGKGRTWPTPSARDWKGASDPEKRKAAGRQVGLNDQVKMWPTPTAAEAGKISNRANYGQKGLSNHPAIVGEPTRPKEKKSRKGEKNWPTPVARDYKGPQPTVRKNGQPRATHLPNAVEEEPSNGQLNPTWVEAYLMGWPVAWTSMEPMPPEVFHEWERTFLTGPIDSSA